MRHEEFSHSVRIDFVVNLQARTAIRVLLPAPPRDQLTVIDWWTWYTEAQSGTVDEGDSIALMEGPLNVQRSFEVDANSFRDNRDFHVLILGQGTGSLTTEVILGGGFPFMAFPRGLMTAQELFFGVELGDTGTKRFSTSLGFHAAHVTRNEWLWAKQATLNRERKGAIVS
jgi:hypothetical protein